jgi:cell division ATPase FtsA
VAPFDYALSRESFNALIERYIKQTVELCRQLVTEAHLDWGEIRGVLLVGGSCKVPYVQEAVSRTFGTPTRPLLYVEDPELAICQGAAVFGQEPKTEPDQSNQPDQASSDSARISLPPQASAQAPTADQSTKSVKETESASHRTPAQDVYHIYDDPFEAFKRKGSS